MKFDFNSKTPIEQSLICFGTAFVFFIVSLYLFKPTYVLSLDSSNNYVLSWEKLFLYAVMYSLVIAITVLLIKSTSEKKIEATNGSSQFMYSFSDNKNFS
jgi:hypothetical protein